MKVRERTTVYYDWRVTHLSRRLTCISCTRTVAKVITELKKRITSRNFTWVHVAMSNIYDVRRDDVTSTSTSLSCNVPSREFPSCVNSRLRCLGHETHSSVNSLLRHVNSRTFTWTPSNTLEKCQRKTGECVELDVNALARLLRITTIAEYDKRVTRLSRELTCPPTRELSSNTNDYRDKKASLLRHVISRERTCHHVNSRLVLRHTYRVWYKKHR